ncbi:MAG: hypothetical protein ACRDQ4_21445 [Pseudonocardiaceae bacterium]
MPDGSRGEPGEETGDSSGAPRSSLAGLVPSRLREWLPGVFAARLLRGGQLPSGRIVGETDWVVHLFPIPSGRVIPEGGVSRWKQWSWSGGRRRLLLGFGSRGYGVVGC